MGTWGSGLYSNDDAADFVSLVRTVLKLPKTVDELVALLSTAAEDDLADQTSFYLILADQFEKRGINHSNIFLKAVSILEEGIDIEELRKAEVDDQSLKSRAKSNLRLLTRLKNPRPEKPRKTFTKPQNAIVAPGDYVCFPTQLGNAPNPYFPQGAEGFVQDGWGLVQIHDTGWEFEYLNWVKLFPLVWHHERRPILEDAIASPPLSNLGYGTLPATHFKRMQMRIIGNGAPRVDASPPGEHDCTARFVAINDISISNLLLGLGLPPPKLTET
jgi:hypothetical protein